MKNLRITAIVSALIGLTASAYLTWAKITHQNVVCIEGMGDCNIVNSSSYAEWRGIPIALIGMIGYLLILALLVLYKNGKSFNRLIPITLFCFTLFGAMYSFYLTYIEIFRIHALCQWCLISALAMVYLFITATVFISKSKLFESIHLEE